MSAVYTLSTSSAQQFLHTFLSPSTKWKWLGQPSVLKQPVSQARIKTQRMPLEDCFLFRHSSRIFGVIQMSLAPQP
jgi:hypothetical protein